MDLTGITRLLGIHIHSTTASSKKSEDLPHWIDQALEGCKSPDITKTVQREAIPAPDDPHKQLSTTSDDLLKGVERQLCKEPASIDQELQEIDKAIDALEGSFFREDIKNLQILRFLTVTIRKLQELKWAIKTNDSFHFDHLSTHNPLVKLIEMYYETLADSIKRPLPIDLLKNPQELAFGKMHILDNLIELLNSHKETAKELVHQENFNRVQQGIQMAAQGNVSIAENIDTFHITNPKARVSIAKTLARHPSYHLSVNIGSFRIKDEQDRIEIAKVAAKTKNSQLAQYLRNFEITDKEALFEIAKILAETPNSCLSSYIEDFDFDDSQRLELAQIAAATLMTAKEIEVNPEVSQNIDAFNLTREEDRFEIAKKLAATPKSGLAHSIKNFGLTKDHLLVIAEIAAKTPKSEFCANIDNFEIADERIRLHLATLAAGTQDSYLCCFIDRFEISKEEDRFGIAKIAARTEYLNYSSLSEHILIFRLRPDHLFEIAKIAARTPHSKLFEHIANFRLTKEELLEIAKIAAATQDSGLCKYVANFGLTKEELLEIAKIAAKTPKSQFAMHFKRFNIELKDHLEFCRMVASTPKSGLPEHIKKFSIPREEDRIAIAMIAAATTDSFLSEHIKQFTISDENARVEIAKIAAKDPYSELSEYIGEYDIQNEEARVEIAKIAAMTPSSELTEHIQNFEITREEDRVAIAKIAAKTVDSILSNHIELFDISGANPALFEIAKIEAKTTKGDLFLHDYDLDEERQSLFFLLVFSYRISDSNAVLDPTEFDDIIPPFVSSKDYSKLPQELKAHFEKLDQKLSTASSDDKPFIEATLQFQKCLYLFLYESAKDKALFDSLAPSVLKVLDFRNKGVAIESALALAEFISQEPAINAYKASMPAGYAHLPMIFFTKLALDAEMPIALQTITSHLGKIDKGMKKDDAKLTPLLKGLIAIENDDSLPPQAKVALILQFLNAKIPLVDAVKSLGVLSTAKLLHHPSLRAIDSQESLKTTFFGLLEANLFQFSPDERIENFETLYESISDGTRMPYGLEIYTANVLSLEDEALMRAIQTFVRALCTKSFPEIRYDPKISPHLEAMDKRVLSNWMDTANRTYQEKLPDSLEAKSSDAFDDLFLCGTEVMDSCQRIDGTASLTKCLPGYILNGADQILAIKDKATGKIKSRCILRLLLIERDGRFIPVLYQERIYPLESVPEEQKVALKNMAKKRALELGLELYTENLGQTMPETLLSLGGPAPWEYVDAQKIGVTEKSQFSINQFQRVDLVLQKNAA